MEGNPDQPRKDIKANVANLAKVGRLVKFDDLSLIERYASKFGVDPDWVYDNTSFGTIANFAIMWKEMDEYQERYQYIWAEINTPPTK
jgi:hypothetical protein